MSARKKLAALVAAPATATRTVKVTSQISIASNDLRPEVQRQGPGAGV